MKFSFEQLEAFVAAAEEGSFSAAARRLGKAQSAVSTAVSNLEIDFGVPLFDRSGKSPVITDAGQTLLREAILLLEGAQTLHERALAMSNDETSLRIAVDEAVAHSVIPNVLKDFDSQFPEAEVHVLVGQMHDISEMVDTDKADLALFMPPSQQPFGSGLTRLDARLTGYMPFIPVAAAEHRLAALAETQGIVRRSDIGRERQILPVSRAGEPDSEAGVFSGKIWMVESMMLMRTMVLQGLGWGFFPEYLVRDDIAQGRLVRLPAEFEPTAFQVPIYIVRSGGRSLGKTAQWLIDRIATSIAENT